MEQLNNTNNERISKTKRVLNKLNQIYGVENYKGTIEKYAEYLKLRRENLISIGNANVIIKVEIENGETQKLIELIYKLLKTNKIISGKYKQLAMSKIKDNETIQKIEEQLLIIETNSLTKSVREDIYSCIRSNKDKVFIIIDKTSEDWCSNEISNELVTWQIKITEPTIEEKNRYIKSMLRKNHIKVAKQCNFIQELSKKSISEVNQELVEVVVNCKSNKCALITDNLLKQMNKKEYLKVEKQTKGMQELNNLIGLEEVKKQVKQIINYIKVNKSRGRAPSLHMVFEGNPGTGKTEVSRIIGKIFAEEDILHSEEKVFVESERADLIGKYIGHTAAKTKDMIEKAKGGVLFIDEAYSLSPGGSDKDFGRECIATLIKGMEDNRDNLCVILAGYTKEMEELLKVNSGFESRIQFKIKFPDYAPIELYEIFRKMVKEQNYKLTSSCKFTIMEYFEKESKKKNFSNGRCVRNLFEKIKFEQAERVFYEDNADKDLIKKCDIDIVIQKLNQENGDKIRIGFAS